MIRRGHCGAFKALKSHIDAVRFNSKVVRPPRNTFVPILNPLQLTWHTRVPSGAKLSGALGSVAGLLTHVHPNILVTLGPPSLLFGYYAYRYTMQKYRGREISRVSATSSEPTKQDIVRIQTYDESSIENVRIGLETQFDHFKSQIIELVERRIIDYVGNEPELKGVCRNLIDENSQFNVNVHADDLDTFIILETSDKNEFIKLSCPLYSSKDIIKRRRIGSCEIHLLEQKRTPAFIEYHIRICISPYKFFSRRETQTIPGLKGGVMNSSLLKSDESEHKM